MLNVPSAGADLWSPHQRVRSAVLLTFIAIGTTGCTGLNYDRQVAALAFSGDRSAVRCLLIYEGLRVQGNSPKDLTEAKEQLKELFRDRHEFWLGDTYLLLRFSLRPPDAGKDAALQNLLRKHVTIDRAEFFESTDARLCAYQILTVRNPETLVAGLNPILTAHTAESVKEDLAKPVAARGTIDLETLRLLEKACRGKFEWIRFEPGRLSVTVPASPSFSRQIKSEVLGLATLEKAENAFRGSQANGPVTGDLLGEFARLHSRMGDLRDHPWSFDQRKDQFTISLGYGNGEPIVLSPRPLPVRPAGPFDKDLADFARGLQVPRGERIAPAELVDRFLQHQRDGRE